MTARVALLCLAFVSVASVAAAQTPPVARRVTLELSDVSVARLVPALSAQLHEPVVVLADAQSVARCAHVSVSTGGSQPVDHVLTLITDALRPAGLALRRDATGIRIEHIEGAPSPPGCLPPPPPPRATDAEDAAAMAPILAGIHTRPDGTHVITTAARDALFSHQDILMRVVRVIPREENGVVIGVRLYGIRAGSVLALLGFQNGDTLRRINGLELSTPERALDAYSRLRDADHMDVEVTREDAAVTVHIVLDAAAPPHHAH